MRCALFLTFLVVSISCAQTQSSTPDVTKLLITGADEQAKQGKYAEAEKIYRDVLIDAPGDTSALKGLAAVLYRQDKIAESAAILDKLPKVQSEPQSITPAEVQPHNGRISQPVSFVDDSWGAGAPRYTYFFINFLIAALPMILLARWFGKESAIRIRASERQSLLLLFIFLMGALLFPAFRAFFFVDEDAIDYSIIFLALSLFIYLVCAVSNFFTNFIRPPSLRNLQQMDEDLLRAKAEKQKKATEGFDFKDWK